jgi:hypothetical protein
MIFLLGLVFHSGQIPLTGLTLRDKVSVYVQDQDLDFNTISHGLFVC